MLTLKLVDSSYKLVIYFPDNDTRGRARAREQVRVIFDEDEF